MKKIISLMLVLIMVLSLAACAGKPEETEATEGVTVMTHDEFIAAAIDSEVVIETYVQAHQSWWDNKITVYCQSPDGAYFLYEMACSEEDAGKLVPGTKIRVTGFKGEWSGEIEIMDATFEFVEGGDSYIAKAQDVTNLLGTDELINHQNEFVSFTGLTIEAISYKNDAPGDDIYVTVSLNGNSYDFCVERYLTDPDSEVYTTVGTLNVGDVVDMEGFLYWYENVNTHITSVTLVTPAPTAPAVSDFENSDTYAAICSVIDGSMAAMNPEYEYDAEDGVMYIALYAPEGFADALLADPASAAASWTELSGSFSTLSSQIKDLISVGGYPDISCCIGLVETGYANNPLMAVLDGVVIIDILAE